MGSDDKSSSEEVAGDEDAALFREAMRDVRPLTRTKKIIRAHSKHQALPQPGASDLPDIQDVLADDGWQWDMAESEEWSFARPGLQRYTLRKLRRGNWPVQDELDLHGLNRDEARRILVIFLNQGVLRGLRCVRVIHGRGLSSRNRKPVLKILTGNWLMQHGDVLAFCQALPEQGGSGAVLVLLRNADK
ncbi:MULTISPECIES: Smr/MutS family protein [Nitrosomonas]|uniref:Smr domain n=1 Tax=Nitrosomonas europaea (strain ATCC 19718 / CIP 103999 / KCTC 2705 / NBRC 14298) TaxID=228410 RepID=Q82TG0_NITEU|nr:MULTISPECIES: Smr/MutS family protein [Nitrosomonas]QOJ09401.1 MAG: Smr/MutS family protein [Nitrosomonas sp. H1_AOB3]CAD85839.1 Smr domain [Nitrosomonas europaea ATCC 19718]SDW90850.1 DNA-nicking endonuclease, Smr domain [Nitrosomonas europaea]SET44628.1 DNA-nicking endonuclease, Smr domain [Nitrosomonas europaea]SKA00234.1 DNA-nicking endonuclease, Smr domain [Nitrosomonas europaea]